MTSAAVNAHGPMLIGTMFSIVLYGIIITQVYIYYTTYKKDPKWTKIFVFIIFFADTLNTVFNGVYMYQSLILHFDDPPFLERANWCFVTEPVTTAVIGMMVQLFFAWRILVLTRSRVMTAIVVAFSITGGVCGIVTGYEVTIHPVFSEFAATHGHVVTGWLAPAGAADIIITSTLVWYLVRSFPIQSDKTGFRESDLVIDRIIRVTMQTGLLTSTVAIINLIVYLGDSHSGAHLLLNFPLCKLYSNSLVSSLNSRGGWQYGREGSDRATSSSRDVGAFQDKDNFVRSQGLETAHSGWDQDSIFSTRRGPIDKARHLIDSMRSTNKTKPEVFVHVESHEMRDVGIQDKRPPIAGDSPDAVGFCPTRRKAEPSLGSDSNV
ncbi:hypothetical protein P691DRAFT_774907 [Macrolepiota fuliginosa MF-IS2]|uniref:DUF6534 domain-containing protein n=1 Tax=Macrolepiota fuliginosa MF-IS2 TaxID=1400762 RepID=A0A9P6C5D6_9AGAR|nr:hypothetical protein P691DRAFT_774907 [Macrolepiota fuliginosa MF-IS2]